jgi:hypothetical protein
VTGFLLVLGIAAGYGLFVLAFPTASCPRVVTVERKGKPPRTKVCPKCKGRGFRYRTGATFVHRFAWSLAGDRFREQLKGRLEASQQREDADL